MSATRNISALAINTWREAVRGKIFAAVIFAAALIVAAASLFGSVTIGDQVKVTKDFGFFCISLMSAAFIVIVGASLLQKELERKTVYNILSKAVERREMLLGKYLGMLATASALAIILGLALLVFTACFDGRLDLLIIQGTCFTIFEAIILCAAAMFFASIVVTPILSGLFTFALFIAGCSAGYLDYFAGSDSLSAPARTFVRILEIILPRLDKLNHSNDLVYGLGASPSELFWSLAYCAAYASILLLISNVFFARREFN